MVRLLGRKAEGDLLSLDFVKRLRSAIRKASDASKWDRTRQALSTQDARKVVNEAGIVPIVIPEADLRLGEKHVVRTIITRHYYHALASSDAALVNLSSALTQMVADIRDGKTDVALKRCIDGLVYAGGAHKRLRKELLQLIGAQGADYWNQEPPAEWTVATDAGKETLDIDAATKEIKTQKKRKESAPRTQGAGRPPPRSPAKWGSYDPDRDRDRSYHGNGGGKSYGGPARPFFPSGRGGHKGGHNRS